MSYKILISKSINSTKTLISNQNKGREIQRQIVIENAEDQGQGGNYKSSKKKKIPRKQNKNPIIRLKADFSSHTMMVKGNAQRIQDVNQESSTSAELSTMKA